ncbi:MAG TPA: alpha/beta hydrolase [Acidimicrobiales bacterium]|nr:alpha/beta hydrolase [Acidimicrobiales bacterium]
MATGSATGALVGERSIVVNGLRSPVLEAGPPAGEEAVVFVHGNPGSSEDWRDLVGLAGVFTRAIALDMPGFGKADKPRSGYSYTVTGYGEHLGAALDQLGIKRVHLVLHDFGGPWGLAWAAASPDQLASVVLIDTGVLRGYRWHYLAKIWRSPIGGDLFMAGASRPAFGLLLRHGNHGGLPKAFVDRMWEDFDRGTRRAVLRLYRATSDVASASERLHAALAPLQVPGLVIWGANDPYIASVFAGRQAETFAVDDVVVLPGSGHWPFVDNPEAVAGATIPFLQRVMAPR